MKVTLEKGELIEIALTEGNQIVGTLSLQLQLGATTLPQRGRPAGRPAGSTTASQSEAPAGGKPGRKRGGRKISAEARARMAEAQRRRWEKFRSGKK